MCFLSSDFRFTLEVAFLPHDSSSHIRVDTSIFLVCHQMPPIQPDALPYRMKQQEDAVLVEPQ